MVKSKHLREKGVFILAKELRREIGTFTALATVMGTVIGGGVFFKTASVVAANHSANMTLVAWLLGGLLTICAGLTSAELAAAIPRTGGAMRYLEYTYGKPVGFLMGWAQMLVYYPANIAALSIIFGVQFVNLFQIDTAWKLPIAIICGLSLTSLNFLGARVGGRVQSIALIFKLIPIVVIVIFGLFAPAHTTIQFWPITTGDHIGFGGAFASSLLATMFAYDGWINIGNIAGEMKHPERDLPRAIVLGLALITVVYTLINLVFLRTLPVDMIAGNQNAAAEAAMRLFGEFGGKLVTIGILISVYGAINGYTMTGMRVPYALATEDSLPLSKYFGRLSRRTYVPYFAGSVQFGIALLMMLMGSFDILTDMLVFVMWLFNCLIFIAIFVLRKREPELSRPYKVPGFPIIPLIALVGGIFIVVTTLVTETGLAVTGLALTLVGLPIYFIHQRRRKPSTEE
ncbi:APC family permease [Levilactobacillus tujiorum]|uniref:Amino acid permease n=1 Tax=Levilactobacillus tujiorum TaxID=2912243 RepID=A0ABX1L6D4_9LACO|nr:amino acid permease [Levilactobacillus tujiorum]NLR12716.1 amino acid permease [Lactobacillus sp. HBUAS51387]NLR30631.1 amino acid permease [Levilactobacillus tujiorum]